MSEYPGNQDRIRHGHGCGCCPGRHPFHEIVGCIAGDDTIMCAIRSVDDTIIVMEKIKKMVED